MVTACKEFELKSKDLTAYYIHTDGTPEGLKEGNLVRRLRYHILYKEAQEAINFLNEWLAAVDLHPIDDLDSVVSHPSIMTNRIAKLKIETHKNNPTLNIDKVSGHSQAIGGIEPASQANVTSFPDLLRQKDLTDKLQASHSETRAQDDQPLLLNNQCNQNTPKKPESVNSVTEYGDFRTPMLNHNPLDRKAHSEIIPHATTMLENVNNRGPNGALRLSAPLSLPMTQNLPPSQQPQLLPPMAYSQTAVNWQQQTQINATQHLPLRGQLQQSRGAMPSTNQAPGTYPRPPRTGQNVQFSQAHTSPAMPTNQNPVPGHGMQPQTCQNYYGGSMDPSTRYRLRCDLLQGLGDPFDGRAEFFSQWYTTLNKRILECGQECDSLDAINIIIANTAGEVKETVKRLLSAGISDPDCTLSRIWETIHERFGSTDDLSDSLINQLENLKAVGNVTDIKGLHNVLDTCSIVESHMLVYPDLRFLNFKRGLQIVLDVLPERIRTRWKERSFQYRNNTGIDADFSFLVQFLVNECKFWRAQAPAGSVSKSTKTPYIGTQNKKQYKTNNTKLDTDNKHSKTVEKKSKFCQFHQFSGHSIDECFGFEQEHYATRKRFAGDKNLCYTCLGSHRAQDCDVKSSIKCRVCGSSHVTAMHRGPIPRSPRAGRPSGGTIPSHRYRQVSAKGSESTSRDYHDYGGSTSRQQRDATRDHEGAAAARAPSQDRGSGFKHQYEAGGAYGPVIDAKNNCITVCGSKSRSNVCSKTLLVDIAHESKPGSLRALCIVDEQSNAYFCDPSIVKYFGIAATQEDYDLDTMNGKFTYKGESIRGLRVKGAFSGEYHSLPAVLTHPEIPNNKGEVATTRIIEAHPHLSYYASYFPHSVDDFDVLLLIGANCGELMFSTSWGDHAPYIHQTPLGLAVVGPVCTSESQPLKALRTSITPTSGKLCTMQRRFVPQYNKEKLTCPFETRDDDDLPAMSQENIVFYDILKESIGVNEAGNIQMDLPIKPNAEIPKNKWPVFYRTKNTLSRLKRKGKELQSCLKVMSEYLEAGHFEQVGAVETTSKLVNHIHIFPVYNESKDKTRLVFNSAAAIHGKSLNSVLLPGIDEGSKLLGVLLRFRIGEYGFSADIEKMFHSFHVSEEFRDLLRFWWFRDNDPSKDLVEYRAKVMIFGNRTSPA